MILEERYLREGGGGGSGCGEPLMMMLTQDDWERGSRERGWTRIRRCVRDVRQLQGRGARARRRSRRRRSLPP
jgi:hypothetical protein